MTETITETTVGDLDGVLVGVANIWERDFVDAGGDPRHGITARVSWTDAGGNQRWEVVGVGSQLALGGAVWRVARVEKSAGTLGEVFWERDTAR